MKNKIKQIKLLNFVLAFLLLIVTIIVSPKLPDVGPIHFGKGNIADRWGSIDSNLFTPIFTIVMFLFLLLCIKIVKITETDKEKGEYPKYIEYIEKAFSALSCGYLILINVSHFIFLRAQYFKFDNMLYGINFIMTKVTLIILGLALILVGRIIPTHTKNKEEKYKIYRIIKYLLYIFGVIFIALPLVFKDYLSNLNIFDPILFLISTVAIVYSYLIYQREPKNINK